MNDEVKPGEKKLLHEYKYFLLLAFFMPVFYITTDLLVYKYYVFHGLYISISVLIYTLTFFLGDVITEVYGYRLARKVIICAIIVEVMFTIIVNFVICLPSPKFFHYQEAYQLVLGRTYRITIADIATYVGITLNAYLLSKWKGMLQGKYFWVRSIVSTLAGVFFETILSNLIVFIGVQPISHILMLMVTSFGYKVLFSLFAVIPASILVNILKKSEDIDVYDHAVEFNPFVSNEK